MADIDNDHLVLISGKSGTGKSASLQYLENHEGVMYLNCETGAKLPFKNEFKEFKITDPLLVFQAFQTAEKNEKIHTIVIDSLTFLMDMYETLYIVDSPNGMKAWGQFAQYFKKLMQNYVAKSTKNVIFTAHTLDTLNEAEMIMEVKVPIKGALKNNGIESYFNCIVSTKKVLLRTLENYGSDSLIITPKEEYLGFKYVYQTEPTKETINERMRGPMGMWSTEETFIDNNIQLYLNRLHKFYS